MYNNKILLHVLVSLCYRDITNPLSLCKITNSRFIASMLLRMYLLQVFLERVTECSVTARSPPSLFSDTHW